MLAALCLLASAAALSRPQHLGGPQRAHAQRAHGLHRAPRALPALLALSAAAEQPEPAGLRAAVGSTLKAVGGFIDRRFFLVGCVVAVGLAALAPEIGMKGGILRPELTVAWGATCGIFLLSGLSMPTNQLAAAALQWTEHGLIQSYSLLFMPAVTFVLCAAIAPLRFFDPAILQGLLVMSALPTTVNMCVALTRSADGNEALAIFNAVLGNFLGVVLTPAILLRLIGTVGSISVLTTLQKLSVKVVIPVALGQVLRLAGSKPIDKKKKFLSRISESLLLMVVYNTFCDTFMQGFALPAGKLIVLLLFISATHLAFFGVAWNLGRLARLSPADHVAFTLTAPQKSLATGLPLLKVMFGSRPDLGLLCTPLILQHPLQLIIDSFFTSSLKTYVAENTGTMKGKSA